MRTPRMSAIVLTGAVVLILTVLALTRQNTATRTTLVRSPYLSDEVSMLPPDELREIALRSAEEFSIAGRTDREETTLMTLGQWLTLTHREMPLPMGALTRSTPVYLLKGYGGYTWQNGSDAAGQVYSQFIVAITADTGTFLQAAAYPGEGSKLDIDANIEDIGSTYTPPPPPQRDPDAPTPLSEPPIMRTQEPPLPAPTTSDGG